MISLVNISKWLIYGLIGAFAVSALVDPARASGTVGAFGGIGSALGNLGRGTQSLFTGVGTGVSKLFNPLFTLRDLIYGPQAGVQTPTDVSQVIATGNIRTPLQEIRQTKAIELDPAAPFTPIPSDFIYPPTYGTPPNYSPFAAEQGALAAANTTLEQSSYRSGFSYSSDPSIASVPVAGAVVHGRSLPLSQAAISHYQALGVTVSPESNQTVNAQNSQNATSNSSASANFSRGAAQSAGYSTGKRTGKKKSSSDSD